MSWLMGLVLGAAIKVTVVAAAALCAASVLRGRSAAVRHWILAIAVCCAVVMPLLQFVVPAWHLQTVSDGGGVLTTIQDVPVAATDAAVPATAPLLQRAALTAGRLWLAGIAVNLLVLLTGLARLAWLACRSTPIVEGPWHDAAQRLARAYGLRKPVALLETPHASLLATWGLFRPRIILPAAARGWSLDRIRIVLGHELAHVRRRDWLVQMAAEALAAVYWFNPVVWLLRRRINQESEQAADDAVLGLGVNGDTYATELVDLARTLVTPSFMPAPSIARQSSLERRIRAMLNAHLNRTPLTRTACAVAIAALAALSVPLAGLGAQSGPASLSGTVVDQRSGVMPNLLLTMTNAATSAKAQAKTDGSGRYSFAALAAGTYNLETASAGFKMLRANVTLNAGENATRDLMLQVGSLEETITVTSNGHNLDSPPAPLPRRAPLAVPAYDPAKHRCSSVTTGGCIEPPMKLVDVRPVYPWNHRDVEGVVVLAARIGADGLVKTITPQSAPGPDFAQSAIDAVSQWQFSPTYLGGQAIEVDMKVTINFKVQ
jgi:TonB family protein